jgi:murein DD-endopeptidase MepM/ murein hydrolase activator NlpD
MAADAGRLTARLRSRPAAIAGGVGILMVASGFIVPAAGDPRAAMPPMSRTVVEAVSRSSAAASAAAEAHAAAEQARRAAMKHEPVQGASVSARFGQRGGWSSGFHTGTDFAIGSGAAVVAAAPGTVVSTGYNGAYGNQIQIRHADGITTTYNHLSSIAVRTGQGVGGGDFIGRVGTTGRSTGPHLHFEVLAPDGGFRDPIAWLRS